MSVANERNEEEARGRQRGVGGDLFHAWFA